MKLSHVLGGIIFIGATVQILGAKLISNNIEDGIRGTVKAYSEQANIPMEVSNFKSSWFSSSFDISLHLPPALAPFVTKIGLPVETNGDNSSLNHHISISHGPIVVDGGLQFAAAGATGKVGFDYAVLLSNILESEEDKLALKKMQPELEEFSQIMGSTYTLIVSYSGDVALTAVNKGGSATLDSFPEGHKFKSAQLNMTPSQGSWSLNGDRTVSITEASWEGLTFEITADNEQKLNLMIGPWAIRGAYNAVTEGYWTTDMDATLGAIDLATTFDQKDYGLKINQTSLTSDYKSLNKTTSLVDIGQELTVEGITFRANSGEVSVDRLQFNTDLQNILVELLAAQARNSRLQWTTMGSAQQNDPLNFLDNPALKSAINKQLQTEPRVNITEYSITKNSEKVLVTGFLGIDENIPANALDNEQQPWQYLSGEINLQLSPSMLKAIAHEASSITPNAYTQDQINQLVEMQLSQYEQLGLIIPNGNVYVSNIAIEDDILSVNGKAMLELSQAFAGNKLP